MSEAFMMTDNNDSFDLPRWQTHHIDPLSSSGQAAHHAAQANYYANAAPPPPPPQSSLSPASPPRMNPPVGPARGQPRINQLLEQPPLSRSASLNSGTSPSGAGRANRRLHPVDDIEGAFAATNQSLSPNRMVQGQQGFYPPGVGYQPSSVQSPTSPNTAPNQDGYPDVYYSPGKNQDRASRSPLRGPNTPGSAGLLDSYTQQQQQQAQYSPSNNPTSTYPYAPPPTSSVGGTDSRPPFQSHSRTQSQVKTEGLSPQQSPYTPQGPSMHTFPSPSFGLDNAHPPSIHSQMQKGASSTPATPLGFMQQSHSPSHYYPQDQPMVVDAPPPRREYGFRRVKSPRDLRPRADAQTTGRRMGNDGVYLSPLRQLTTNIVDTYRICNTQFRYESTHNPRRVLTKPSKPAHNDGYDNDDYDYILYVNDWLGTEDGHKYLILDILGQGTFGQVVKCQNMKTHEIVAVKVVKNKPAYFNQSMMEVTILEMLNKNCDPADEHHILRLRDSFIHRSHLCLVFELLSSNLYELIKQNQFQGLSTQLVKVFMAQLLDALSILKDARLIHCDLKPENILLKSLQSPQIKVIDFGSACHERQTVYTYIQSRFYRSPEVLLGMSYTASIDMWSLGCIAVELFLGLPLFPGTSEYNQLTRIIEMLGMPPLSMLNTGKQTNQFFDSQEQYNPHLNQTEKKYRLKGLEQYSREHGTNEQPGKQYFKATNLPDIINTAPMPQTKTSRQGHEMEKELNNRAAFIDFCKGLLDLNPVTRWTPQQARQHPFITGDKFTKPFVPDGLNHQQPNTVVTDPKRPYGGLVPSQPKGTRAYQDAASYNHHLAQHQVYTAQAQSQAANTFRNPYLSQAGPQQSGSSYQSPNSDSSPQQPQLAPPYPQAQPYTPNHQNSQQRLQHRSSNGQLSSSTSMPQYGNQGSSGGGGVPMGQATMSSGGYYSNSNNPAARARANTINQMDQQVPPALARLQHMNQDVIAGRNALTPVLNRDDAMREWERRQAGKSSQAQPYPQLEFLQQQAEMAAAQGGGLSSWAVPVTRYQAKQPSSLAHSYNPSAIIVDDDGSGEPSGAARRDAVMSNVRSAATANVGNDASRAAAAALYGGNTSIITNPPQTYTGSGTTTGNRYPAQPSQGQPVPPPLSQQSSSTGGFDPNQMYMPLQPDQYAYSPQSSAASRQVQPPPQAVGGASSFYATGAQNQPGGGGSGGLQFGTTQSVADQRRGSGMDNWPR